MTPTSLPPVAYRYQGALIGLAIGDALGAPYEFKKPPFTVTRKFGAGVFGTRPGAPTDDTDLAGALADSIIDNEGFAPMDYVARLVAWADTNPPDIGGQTGRAIAGWRDDAEPPTEHEMAAGNGSLMAITPLALYASALSTEDRIDLAHAFTDLTHPSRQARTTNEIFMHDIAQLVRGEEIEWLAEQGDLGDGYPNAHDANIGYCALTHEIAAEAAYSCPTADDAFGTLIDVVALGGDADTNGAVAGALLGARFGGDAWPASVTSKLREFENMAIRGYQLYKLAAATSLTA